MKAPASCSLRKDVASTASTRVCSRDFYTLYQICRHSNRRLHSYLNAIGPSHRESNLCNTSSPQLQIKIPNEMKTRVNIVTSASEPYEIKRLGNRVRCPERQV